MKTKHMLFLHLGLSVLVLASCKKDEWNEPFTTQQSAELSSSDALQWEETREDNFITFSSSIKNSSITSSVAENGLVLVYYKNQAGLITSLPIDNSSQGYWYYKISEGEVNVIFSSQQADKHPDINDFLLVVFTPEKLAALSKAGKNEASIIGLDYASALALSKQ